MHERKVKSLNMCGERIKSADFCVNCGSFFDFRLTNPAGYDIIMVDSDISEIEKEMKWSMKQ